MRLPTLFLPLLSSTQHILTPTSRLRNATRSDALSIATVINAAFDPSPVHDYVYQFRKQYPEEHQRCVADGIGRFMNINNTHTQVIEASNGLDEGDEKSEVIAVAMWRQAERKDNAAEEIRYPSQSFMQHVLASNCTHLDLNITRAIDHELKFNIAKHSVIAPQDLYLDTLATHPLHQLHGAGTQLVKAGLERGKEQGVNVTLIAAPTAETFYEHVGFVNTVNVSISRVEGEGEAFVFNVMKYEFGEGVEES